MLIGSEYNWLVSFSRPTNGTPRARLARGGFVTLAIAIFCLLCAALQAAPPHVQLLREARAAQQAGDTAQVLAKLEAARALRPDYPRILVNLARAYAAAGRGDDAVAQLRELAVMGLEQDISADPALAPLRAHPDFSALVNAFAANGATDPNPNGTGPAIAHATGIIEGLAIHPVTGESFFSDVHHRCIWSLEGSGDSAVLRKFSSESDGLLGVFALRIDASDNTLWATCSALPEMKGYAEADAGRAFVAEYDLATRKLRRTHALEPDGRSHVLGDLVLAADGSLYVTDSVSPVIWRLAPGAETHLTKWLEHDDFLSLQGITIGSDGGSLLVADYANGLWRVDLATRAATLLGTPAHTTLFGIDGLYAVPGALVAVQNGVNPQRVIRISLDAAGRPTSVTVLRAGHPAMSDVSLGQVVGGEFVFIGNSGWSQFEGPNPKPGPRTVTILRTPVAPRADR